jgi:hypothetical protein
MADRDRDKPWRAGDDAEQVARRIPGRRIVSFVDFHERLDRILASASRCRPKWWAFLSVKQWMSLIADAGVESIDTLLRYSKEAVLAGVKP